MLHGQRKRVTIIYRFLPQYRAPFFDGLRVRLGEENIDLDLIYGKPKVNLKRDDVDLEWGESVAHAELSVAGKRLIYQRLPKSIYDSTLLILMQENCILSNYVAAFNARRRGVRIALWGHGVNFQDKPNSWANWWKRQYSSRADWWFAYTAKTATLVAAMPYPEDRVTIVNNAIDTRVLIDALASITKRQKTSLRQELNIGTGPVGIYCGAMYPEKRLPFMVEAVEIVRREIPQFELILIGAGPDARFAIEASAKHKWIHYVGPKFSLDRVPYFALSQVFLMPGAVGLAALDSFALGTPIFTTRYPFHGPEIEYIEDGINGIVSENNVPAYAQAVINAVGESSVLTPLRANARGTASKYSLEAMVSNFAEGVLKAIQAPLARHEKRSS